MNKQEAIQSQIDEIMDGFDFRACCIALSALAKEDHGYPEDWVLHESKDRTIEFSEPAIRTSARQYLKTAASTKAVLSGAYFTAIYTEGVEEDNGEPFVWLSLHFGMSSDNEGEPYNE